MPPKVSPIGTKRWPLVLLQFTLNAGRRVRYACLHAATSALSTNLPSNSPFKLPISGEEVIKLVSECWSAPSKHSLKLQSFLAAPSTVVPSCQPLHQPCFILDVHCHASTLEAAYLNWTAYSGSYFSQSSLPCQDEGDIF